MKLDHVYSYFTSLLFKQKTGSELTKDGVTSTGLKPSESKVPSVSLPKKSADSSSPAESVKQSTRDGSTVGLSSTPSVTSDATKMTGSIKPDHKLHVSRSTSRDDQLKSSTVGVASSGAPTPVAVNDLSAGTSTSGGKPQHMMQTTKPQAAVPNKVVISSKKNDDDAVVNSREDKPENSTSKLNKENDGKIINESEDNNRTSLSKLSNESSSASDAKKKGEDVVTQITETLSSLDVNKVDADVKSGISGADDDDDKKKTSPSILETSSSESKVPSTTTSIPDDKSAKIGEDRVVDVPKAQEPQSSSSDATSAEQETPAAAAAEVSKEDELEKYKKNGKFCYDHEDLKTLYKNPLSTVNPNFDPELLKSQTGMSIVKKHVSI